MEFANHSSFYMFYNIYTRLKGNYFVSRGDKSVEYICRVSDDCIKTPKNPEPLCQSDFATATHKLFFYIWI